MFCVVTVLHVHVLCYYSVTCTLFVQLQCYMYVFCVVTVLGVHVLDSYSVTFSCFLLRHLYERKNFKSTALETILFNI